MNINSTLIESSNEDLDIIAKIASILVERRFSMIYRYINYKTFRMDQFSFFEILKFCFVKF